MCDKSFLSIGWMLLRDRTKHCLGSSVESTEKDIDTRWTKAWTAINRLSIIWKSDLTDKMKRSFFQAAVTSILLYGCTTWTLTKRLEKKLDGNYTRMLRAILNKSWRQHPTRHQLYDHLPPITKTIQVRRTRHAGHCWRSRDELIRDVLLWTPTHGRAKAGRPARTYIQQLCEDTGSVLKTYLGRWTIGRSSERGSGISVLPARHDDDDDDDDCLSDIAFLLTVMTNFQETVFLVLPVNDVCRIFYWFYQWLYSHFIVVKYH